MDFLIERVLVKTRLPAGEVRFSLRTSPAKKMDDKSGWSIFSASLDSPFHRTHVPRGIVQTVYLQDGLHAEQFLQRQRARHALYYQLMESEMEPDEVWWLSVQDWQWGFWCVLHIASLAVKWGMRMQLRDAAVLESVHLSVASLRNAVGVIMDQTDEFIATRVVCRDSDSDEDKAIRRAFWKLFGVPEKFLDTIMEVDAFYDPTLQVLFVHGALDFDDERYEKIRSVFYFFYQWTNFSATRWAASGPSSRKYICSFGIGIDYVVVEVMANPKANKT